MKLLQLRPAIELAWSIDTTWSPESYEGKDPAWGQCGVTTMYLHEKLGFKMLSGTAHFDGRTTRHFWNFKDGIDVDLTARQFPVGTVITDPYELDLKAISQGEWFRNRYKAFIKRVDPCLHTQI